MPSDDAVLRVLQALAPAAEPWRSAVVATEEEIRGLLGGPATPAVAAHELGEFAAGRIDVERFAGLVTRARTMEDSALVRLRVAWDTLVDVAGRPADRMFVASVPAGGRLRDTLDRALAEVGRAFGAGREAALARQGEFVEERHGSLHLGFPFAEWTRRERRLAAPVVVEVDGAALDAADVAPFLDGGVRIALVVRGACAPAALVRLVTPGTFVMQTGDPAAFSRLAAAPCGVAALVPDGAAHFVHDPAAGRSVWERTRIEKMPAEPPRRAVGPWSAEQQAEELRQLAALALRPSEAAVAAAAAARQAGGPGDADPAERLASWLLEASGASAA